MVAAVVVVLAGTLGTLWLRGWGRVGFEVPSVPWYFSFPFYVFPDPQLELGWAAATIPVVAATVAATLALSRSPVGWPWRVAASVGLAGVLALAVAALAGGPAGWGAPFDYAGEYPAASVGSAPSRRSCASSRPACRSCPVTPPATRPAPWWCMCWSLASGRG
jgi:hypothetical protein